MCCFKYLKSKYLNMGYLPPRSPEFAILAFKLVQEIIFSIQNKSRLSFQQRSTGTNTSKHFTGCERRFNLFFWKKSTFAIISFQGLVSNKNLTLVEVTTSLLIPQWLVTFSFPVNNNNKSIVPAVSALLPLCRLGGRTDGGGGNVYP